MADLTVEQGTIIAFGVSGSFSPADTGSQMASSIDVALTLAGVVDDAARQSAKADLTANRARAYALFGCVDYTGETPSQSGFVDYYWAPSPVAATAEGNVAGNSGADADVPDGVLASATLEDFLEFCLPIGSLKIHDGAGVQNGYVGTFEPPTRYGQLVVVNRGGDTFENDDVEMHQVLVPIVDDAAAS